eukprot:gene13665-18337_t
MCFSFTPKQFSLIDRGSILKSNDILFSNCFDLLTLKTPFDNIFGRINESITTLFQNSNHYEYGPQDLKLVFLTRSTSDIYTYSLYSLFLQSIYCYYNNYVLLPLFTDSKLEDYLYHRKLTNILETLNSYGFMIDYIIWLDADLILLDFNFSIRDLIIRYENSHIIISADVSTMVNTGMFIMKNSVWAKRFVSEWINARNSDGVMNDQLGFDYVYKQRAKIENIDDKIKVLSPEILNSIAPPMGTLEPLHKVLHLAAESLNYRRRVFYIAVQHVCQAYDSVSSKSTTFLFSELMTLVPPQLGINRTLLLDEAII